VRRFIEDKIAQLEIERTIHRVGEHLRETPNCLGERYISG